MNLKRIEIFGFKSFADKVSIDFTSNITGIVGPNGCGKSNVADAVRWVLGEQSPTVLRCKKMPEVIFSGTDNRKSLSYCEVSLFLDNEKKFYAVDFDEVVITRKLYKSGESEYLLNNTVCRLKDIIELLRDSGIGKEGYSIIGQGKIESILDTKPEARRQIFEDAAGISKFRARRQETERNLDRTTMNMERLNDTMMEIERSLAPLEEDAKTANKAKELKHRMKMIDVHYYLHQTEHSAETRATLTKRVSLAQKASATAMEELNTCSRDYNLAMMDIENSDIYLNTLRGQITERLVVAEHKLGETKVLSERLTNLKEKGQDIVAEIASCSNRQIDREQRREESLVKLEKCQTELVSQEALCEELGTELEKIKAEVQHQELTLQHSNDMVSNTTEQLHLFDKDETKLAVELNLLTSSLGASKEDYKEKLGKIKATERDIGNISNERLQVQEERDAKVSERNAVIDRFNIAQSELRKDTATLEKSKYAVDEYKFKINNVKKITSEYLNYGHAVQYLMRDAGRNPALQNLIIGTVGNVITVPRDLQLAIEIALGGSIQNIIVEKDSDATQIIRYMREKNLGRATFLPIASMRGSTLPPNVDRILDEDGVVGVASDLIRYNRRYGSIISNLLGRTIIVEDSETAMKINKRYGTGTRMVTLQGSVFAPSGAITGGSNVSSGSSILRGDSQLKALEDKLKIAENQYMVEQSNIDDLKAEIAQFESDIKVINARINQLEKDLTAYDVRLTALQNEASIFQTEIDRILAKDAENSAKIKALQNQIQIASADKNSAETEKISAKDLLSEQRLKLNEAREELAEAQESYTDVANAVTSLKREIELLNTTINDATAEIKALQAQMIDAERRKAINEQDVIDAESKVDISKYDEEDRKQIESMQKEVEELEATKKLTQQKCADLNNTKELLNGKIREAEEKRVREESALERMQAEIVMLTERIATDYDMDYESAIAYRKANEAENFELDLDKAVSESTSLRRKIERLGPLNELAESRFIEEKERHGSLQSQYDDLVKAGDDLQKLIKQLTSEMTEKFTKSFEQIQVNFSEVFCELFNGGKAQLVLDMADADSVLEAGIDVIAEPPGKKPQRLSLLSGGERALTAIAILFAIIKLKPMPFSLLDEIEAALDDSNVHLFAQYLRKFADKTQFVVVTHRKPTMSLADMLYGVTNQEKGVSTLVSVKLEEALDTLEKENK